jgi:hypothetical protein
MMEPLISVHTGIMCIAYLVVFVVGLCIGHGIGYLKGYDACKRSYSAWLKGNRKHPSPKTLAETGRTEQ